LYALHSYLGNISGAGATIHYLPAEGQRLITFSPGDVVDIKGTTQADVDRSYRVLFTGYNSNLGVPFIQTNVDLAVERTLSSGYLQSPSALRSPLIKREIHKLLDGTLYPNSDVTEALAPTYGYSMPYTNTDNTLVGYNGFYLEVICPDIGPTYSGISAEFVAVFLIESELGD
jgi:hypothetical protein